MASKNSDQEMPGCRYSSRSNRHVTRWKWVSGRFVGKSLGEGLGMKRKKSQTKWNGFIVTKLQEPFTYLVILELQFPLTSFVKEEVGNMTMESDILSFYIYCSSLAWLAACLSTKAHSDLISTIIQSVSYETRLSLQTGGNLWNSGVRD